MVNNDFLNELKEALNKKNVVIGSRQAIRLLKTGELKSIIVSQNCPENIKKDINHYAKMRQMDVKKFNGDSKQLGILCGRPFSIATIAIKK